MREAGSRRDELEVIDWASLGTQNLDRDRLAWRGPTTGRNLSEVIWRNPHPEKTIDHLDFVSAEDAAAPFLADITAN